MSSTETADRTTVEFPASVGFRNVGRLVLGGIAARFELPLDRVDDLLLAVDSVLLQEPLGDTIRLETEATSTELRVRLGSFRSGLVDEPSVRRVLARLVDQVGEERQQRRGDRGARRLRHPPSRRGMRMAQDVDFVALIEAHRAGDEQARDALVERYMPLVKSLAARYSGRGEPQEDLIQVGSIGLLLSIERFDTERQVQFTTYAVPTIVGEIQRHFRDRAWALHVPRRMKELSVRLTRTVQVQTAELGRAPTIAELAEATGVEEDEVVEALQTSEAYSTRSLSQPLGHEGATDETMQDVLGIDDRGFSEVEDTVLVESGLDALDERERRIVELRFFDGLTQSEIAAQIGISQMHVSRLLRRALHTMRGRLEDAMEEEVG